MRSERRRKHDEAPEATAPDRPVPEHPLLLLQRSAGNAAVSRVLARQELADPFTAPREDAQPAVEPHAEGQDADTPQLLDQPVAQAGPMLGDVAEAAVEGAKSTPGPADVPAWAARSPATNQDLSTWILEGTVHGFVSLHNDSRKQLETFEAGGKYALKGGGGGTIDPTGAVLPVLEVVHGIVAARANRWLAGDPKAKKEPLAIFWMARNLKGGDAHTTGAALDAGGLDFTKPAAAKQVVQILTDLPVANYKIGLPYQGPFFSVFDSLMSFQNKASKDAGEDGTPADVTTPGLVEWESPLSTATWKDGAWVPKRASASARSKIQDVDLRTKLGGFDGKAFEVFPDRPNHIHIQRK